MPLLARRLAAVFASLALVSAAARAQATVVTFDVSDADRPAVFTAIRTGGTYGGIRWDAATHWSPGNFAGSPGLAAVLVCSSAPYCNSPNGSDASGREYGAFGFLQPVTFVGAAVSGPSTRLTQFGGDGSPNQVFWELLRGGSVVFTSPVLTLTPTPQFFGSAYTGQVDAVRIVGSDFMMVDDVTYVGVTATPEPSSLALAASGLALLVGAARRRRRA